MATPTLDTNPPQTASMSRKRWMWCALAISLMLHLLTVVCIIAAGSAIKNTPDISAILIENIAPTPAISRPPTEALPVAASTETEPQSYAPQVESPLQAPPAAPPSNKEMVDVGENGPMTTPLGLGLTYGRVSSLAEGNSLREDIRGYYFELVEKINREWWKRAAVLKEPIRRDGIIELYLRPDGSIDSQSVYQGTGSREADKVIQEAIEAASPLPPLPASFDRKLFLAPLRIKAPAFLFRFKS